MVVEGIECNDISQFLKFAVLQFLVFCRSFLKDPQGGDQSHLDVVVMWVCNPFQRKRNDGIDPKHDCSEKRLPVDSVG